MLLRRHKDIRKPTKISDLVDNKEEIKLEDMKVPDLKELAKEKGIEGYSEMKKAELVTALKGEEKEAGEE